MGVHGGGWKWGSGNPQTKTAGGSWRCRQPQNGLIWVFAVRSQSHVHRCAVLLLSPSIRRWSLQDLPGGTGGVGWAQPMQRLRSWKWGAMALALCVKVKCDPPSFYPQASLLSASQLRLVQRGGRRGVQGGGRRSEQPVRLSNHLPTHKKYVALWEHMWECINMSPLWSPDILFPVGCGKSSSRGLMCLRLHQHTSFSPHLRAQLARCPPDPGQQAAPAEKGVYYLARSCWGAAQIS